MAPFVIPMVCLFAACGFNGVSCGCEWFAEHLGDFEERCEVFHEWLHRASGVFAGLAILAIAVGLVGWPMWAMVRGMLIPF